MRNMRNIFTIFFLINRYVDKNSFTYKLTEPELRFETHAGQMRAI